MADLLTQTDVEAALLRPLTATETQYMPTLMSRVSAMLRTAKPGIDDRIAAYPGSGGIDPLVVAGVLAGVIKRYLVNPEGASSKTETAGPLSHSTTYSSSGKLLAGGELAITADDLTQLVSVTTFVMPGTIRLKQPQPAPVATVAGMPAPERAQLIDNGDGTFTITGMSVVDNGDGTYAVG